MRSEANRKELEAQQKNEQLARSIEDTTRSAAAATSEAVQAREDLATARGQLAQKTARIAELERRTEIIQSLELHIDIDAVTPVSTVQSQRATSAGLQSVVALFSAEGNRFRFVTDFTFSEQQIAPKIKRVSFVYRPETPNEILGQRIALLANMKTFACNYSDFFRTIRFETGDQPTKMNISVFLNGVETLLIPDRIAAAGVLASGQADMDVAEYFHSVEQKYTDKIKRAH